MAESLFNLGICSDFRVPSSSHLAYPNRKSILSDSRFAFRVSDGFERKLFIGRNGKIISESIHHSACVSAGGADRTQTFSSSRSQSDNRITYMRFTSILAAH